MNVWWISKKYIKIQSNILMIFFIKMIHLLKRQVHFNISKELFLASLYIWKSHWVECCICLSGSRGQAPVRGDGREPCASDEVRRTVVYQFPRLPRKSPSPDGSVARLKPRANRSRCIHARAEDFSRRGPTDPHLYPQHCTARTNTGDVYVWRMVWKIW